MKLAKILEKAKKYLSLIEEKEDVEKKKVEKLRDKIDDKISKLEKSIKGFCCSKLESRVDFNHKDLTKIK